MVNILQYLTQFCLFLHKKVGTHRSALMYEYLQFNIFTFAFIDFTHNLVLMEK